VPLVDALLLLLIATDTWLLVAWENGWAAALL